LFIRRVHQSITSVFLLTALVGLFLIYPFQEANAPTDGDLDTTSEGSTTMQLEVARLVKISNLVDINFGTYSGSGALEADKDVCVWTNHPDATYVVTASGDGTDSAFTLSSGTEVVGYLVYWNDTTGTVGNSVLAKGEVSATMSGANTASLSCAGTDNANYQIRILEEDLLSVKPGAYIGVVTFVIAPPA